VFFDFVRGGGGMGGCVCVFPLGNGGGGEFVRSQGTIFYFN